MRFADLYEITVTDMIHDGYGWQENGCWTTRTELVVDQGISDLALARRVLKTAGYSGEITEKLGDLWWRCGHVSVRADFIRETTWL